MLFSAVQFGNMQKINKPEVVCDDPEEGQTPESCSEHVSGWPGTPAQGRSHSRGGTLWEPCPPLSSEGPVPTGLCWGPPSVWRGGGREQPLPLPVSVHQRAECEKLLTAAAFKDCLGLVPLEPYVRACVQDRCQCPSGVSCLCSTLAEFSRQCSHAGGRPGNWRTGTLCRKRHAHELGGRGPRGTWGTIHQCTGSAEALPAQGRAAWCPGSGATSLPTLEAALALGWVGETAWVGV